MLPAVPSPADPSRPNATSGAADPARFADVAERWLDQSADHSVASVKPEPRSVPTMPTLKAAEAAARAPRRFAGWVVRVQN